MRTRLTAGVVAVASAGLLVTGCGPHGAITATGSPVTSSPPASPSSPAGAPDVTTSAGTRSAEPTSTAATAGTASGSGEVVLPGGIVLPDRGRTPGATNPAVTPATIHATICRTGYTRTIRPPSSLTTALKEQQLASGYAYQGDTSTADYEEDHLISLELGGAASDERNLWPEPYTVAEGARVKDKVENTLHDLVCSGQLSLATAQQAIAVNWWSAYQRYGGEGMPEVWDGAYDAADTTTAPTSAAATSTTSSATDATARCNDGTYSYSQHRSGTCSHHGGVAVWLNPPSS